MNYLSKKRSSGYMGAFTIMAIVLLASMVRCAPVETTEQMNKDISGLTAEQKRQVMAPVQKALFP